jgi:hypothetical protein
MPWFWLSPLFGALIVVAYCGIPVWLVIRHRDEARGDAVPQSRPVADAAASTAVRPLIRVSLERDAA